MPVIHPCITPERSAKQIIAELRRLLASRRRFAISRKKFLSRWSALRDELAGTEEYREFRAVVRKRSGGVCEECHSAASEQVHHIRQVSRAPELALDPTNAKDLCRRCHVSKHPHMRVA